MHSGDEHCDSADERADVDMTAAAAATSAPAAAAPNSGDTRHPSISPLRQQKRSAKAQASRGTTGASRSVPQLGAGGGGNVTFGGVVFPSAADMGAAAAPGPQGMLPNAALLQMQTQMQMAQLQAWQQMYGMTWMPPGGPSQKPPGST
jgi:hypothetical protein